MNPKKIKKDNTNSLKEMGISVIDHLPHLDITKFRKTEDVAERSLVLAALLQLHFGAPNEFIENWLKTNNLIHSLTENEKYLLATKYDDLSEEQKTNLYWSIEAIWALMWIAGKHTSLTFNTEVEDTLAAMFPDIAKEESTDEFVANFELEPQKKIFTELDKFYRVHWFARDISLKGQTTDKVNLDIIMERRKALEWVCDVNLDWDDVPLDT